MGDGLVERFSEGVVLEILERKGELCYSTCFSD